MRSLPCARFRNTTEKAFSILYRLGFCLAEIFYQVITDPFTLVAHVPSRL
jgi:hypothetical protein